MGLTE